MEYKANAPMKLNGALNVRELGGYMNCDNIRLHDHKILRGGDLSAMTDEDIEKLTAYGIHTCIDLRIGEEKEKPDPFERDDIGQYHATPIAGKVDLSVPRELLYKLYKNILEEHSQELKRVFQIIAAARNGVIFHCTAGKDRTGVTAMLILSLCGVCREQIIADYAASEKNNQEQIKKQLQGLEEKGLQGVPREIFGSNAETMKMTLDYLEENYGNAENYLKEIGVTEAEMESVRSRLLG